MCRPSELYNKYPALYEIDNDWGGFEWIAADDIDKSTYSYIRKASNGKNNMLVVLNMTPVARNNFKVGVPSKKKYKLLLNSDDKEFGGTAAVVPKEIAAKPEPFDGRKYSLTFDLPAYGALIFTF